MTVNKAADRMNNSKDRDNPLFFEQHRSRSNGTDLIEWCQLTCSVEHLQSLHDLIRRVMLSLLQPVIELQSQ